MKHALAADLLAQREDYMIASIQGGLLAKGEKYAIVEANGVGYKVFLTKESLSTLPEIGQEVKLFTYLYLRENETLELYGMHTAKELRFFETLLDVAGVGPRGALTILGTASVDDLERAIASGDERLLERVSGIGKKTAKKILLELQSRYEGLSMVVGETPSEMQDVMDVLVKLGYSEREAREALRHIPQEAKTVEEKIKAALKALGGK